MRGPSQQPSATRLLLRRVSPTGLRPLTGSQRLAVRLPVVLQGSAVRLPPTVSRLPAVLPPTARLDPAASVALLRPRMVLLPIPTALLLAGLPADTALLLLVRRVLRLPTASLPALLGRAATCSRLRLPGSLPSSSRAGA